jgi:hypothetical protein
LPFTPVQYAAIQCHLVIAYHILTELKDKAINCAKAIQAYQEALRVYTPEDFLIQYTRTQINLGKVYRIVAEVLVEVPIDIIPQSCPNPLNVKGKGVLTVAILGTEDFDVTEVDPVTVELINVSPLRWALENVATPYKPKVLVKTVKIRLDKSWGKRQSPSLLATDPWWLLKEALKDRGNWKGLLFGEKEQVICLKKIEDAERTVAVYPKGRLEISQNVLPFNLILQKFGNCPISGDNVYRITELQINNESGDTGELDYVKDYFAKAQFIKMSDAEKLSRPSFEKEDANILIGKELSTDCNTLGPDGYLDLTLKFDAQEIVAALGAVSDGDVLFIPLTGELLDGTQIIGVDVIIIIKKGN